MDELREQINGVPRGRVRRKSLTKRRVQQYAKDYADLFGINDHGKSATDYLNRFAGNEQIEILRCFEQELFPELYEAWFIVDCYIEVEKEKVINRMMPVIFEKKLNCKGDDGIVSVRYSDSSAVQK